MRVRVKVMVRVRVRVVPPDSAKMARLSLRLSKPHAPQSAPKPAVSRRHTWLG